MERSEESRDPMNEAKIKRSGQSEASHLPSSSETEMEHMEEMEFKVAVGKCTTLDPSHVLQTRSASFVLHRDKRVPHVMRERESEKSKSDEAVHSGKHEG